MKTIVCKDSLKASFEAFNILKSNFDSLRVLGLATGSSPLGLYNLMIEDYKEGKHSYQNIISFNLDEYVGLSKDHKNSYHYFMQEQLFRHINLKEYHLPNNEGNLEANCLEYEALIKANPIDIQILGVGRNGHIGFNEPFTSFASETHVVDLAISTRKDNQRFFDAGAVPRQAITMGLKTIMNSHKIILLAFGISKREALKHLVEGEINEEWPVTILQKHPDVTLICDTEAWFKCL